MEKKNELSRRRFCKTASCSAAALIASGTVIGGSALSGKSDKNEIAISNDIKVKVISQKGDCGAGLKIGDVAIIKEHSIEGKICIHALYSFLPKVFAMMYDAKFPWLEDPDVSTSACPDAYNPVIFEISRNK